AIFGLVHAVQEYQSPKMNQTDQLTLLDELACLDNIPGVRIQIQPDSKGRDIYRGRVEIDAAVTGVDAGQSVNGLREGNPAIYTRDYEATSGFFEIDPRSMTQEEMMIVIERIKAVMENTRRR